MGNERQGESGRPGVVEDENGSLHVEGRLDCGVQIQHQRQNDSDVGDHLAMVDGLRKDSVQLKSVLKDQSAKKSET